ncbi:hypothetical protein CDAR_252001 [Caerostris darwini]|uniref:Uncharacterized protein n=1 Tax=Caerostris darwini TaxID=1538125 RepID=A0AAV4VE47_9ARAC|nr:hypothetical protein CDAR_252001 [Caerostris darwini]
MSYVDVVLSVAYVGRRIGDDGGVRRRFGRRIGDAFGVFLNFEKTSKHKAQPKSVILKKPNQMTSYVDVVLVSDVVWDKFCDTNLSFFLKGGDCVRRRRIGDDGGVRRRLSLHFIFSAASRGMTLCPLFRWMGSTLSLARESSPLSVDGCLRSVETLQVDGDSLSSNSS